MFPKPLYRQKSRGTELGLHAENITQKVSRRLKWAPRVSLDSKLISPTSVRSSKMTQTLRTHSDKNLKQCKIGILLAIPTYFFD